MASAFAISCATRGRSCATTYSMMSSVRVADLTWLDWAAAVPLNSAILCDPSISEIRACPQVRELFPCDCGIDLAVAGKGAEAAIRAGDDAILAHYLRKAFDALCDQFGRLDIVGTGVDQARREDAIAAEFRFGPDSPFVLVPRIGGLEQQGGWFRAQHHVDNLLQRNVVIVRAFVIAPAQMHAHLLRRNISGRSIERFDIGLDSAKKIL